MEGREREREGESDFRLVQWKDASLETCSKSCWRETRESSIYIDKLIHCHNRGVIHCVFSSADKKFCYDSPQSSSKCNLRNMV